MESMVIQHSWFVCLFLFCLQVFCNLIAGWGKVVLPFCLGAEKVQEKLCVFFNYLDFILCNIAIFWNTIKYIHLISLFNLKLCNSICFFFCKLKQNIMKKLSFFLSFCKDC